MGRFNLSAAVRGIRIAVLRTGFALPLTSEFQLHAISAQVFYFVKFFVGKVQSISHILFVPTGTALNEPTDRFMSKTCF